MFLGRMKSPTKLNEQVFNGLIYYGVKVLAERAPINWLTYAEDHEPSLVNYCYGTKRADGSEVKGVVAAQSEAVKDEHASVQVLNSIHDTEKIPFMRIIRDRQSFDVKNRTDFDGCMADGYAGMGLNAWKNKPKSKKRQVKAVRRGRLIT